MVENDDLHARPSDSFTLQLAVVDLSCGSSTETYMLSPRYPVVQCYSLSVKLK